jgi:peptidoglycan/xylan/chitin deacetylase (PgdA/CDA1 family)
MDPLWVSVGVTVVLVCITGYYAYQTRRIARAAAEQAQELRQQRISASQPVIWPKVVGWEVYILKAAFENIGNGPALDIDIFIGCGEEPISEYCDHVRHSYMIAGEKREHYFLKSDTRNIDGYGHPNPDRDDLAQIAGKYILLVEWRDLYKSGPFFRASLPFSLEIDADGKLYAKEGVVVIGHIPAKRQDKIAEGNP